MIDLERLTELAVQGGDHGLMRPVIQKELLHYDILYALDQAGLLDMLTFQGGTALRLCYGSDRYSVDLDFTGGRAFTREDLQPIKACIENYIGARYGLEVEVKEPQELKHEREYADLKVDKWQVSIVTAPRQRDVPRQRIKIEVTNITSYSRAPKALQRNYDFLPDGYEDTLVLAETLDEIMADKLVSLVNTVGYVRNRDIWDLRWLKQQGATVRSDWVARKIDDYRISDYPEKLDRMIGRVPDVIRGDTFTNEMLRFLPQDVLARTLGKDKFRQFLCNEIVELLQYLRAELEGSF